MPFEQVRLRLISGEEYGPASLQEVVQWHQQGRVPPDAVLVDAETGEIREISAFPALSVPPPPPQYAAPAPSEAMNHLIPTKNPSSLIAYYCGIFTFFLPLPLGPIALYHGRKGFKYAREVGVGRTHSLVGIIAAICSMAIWLLLGTMIIIAVLTEQ